MTGFDQDVRHLRAKPRLKLFQPTSMRAGGAAVRVHLLDLSATGALVHAARPPARGEQVLIELAGASRPATVMWVDDRRFGVSFRAPLTEAQLADAIPDGGDRMARRGGPA